MRSDERIAVAFAFFILCHIVVYLLKAEPALAGGVGQCGHAAMVAIGSAVECNGLHAGGDCPFGDRFADCLAAS